MGIGMRRRWALGMEYSACREKDALRWQKNSCIMWQHCVRELSSGIKVSASYAILLLPSRYAVICVFVRRASDYFSKHKNACRAKLCILASFHPHCLLLRHSRRVLNMSQTVKNIKPRASWRHIRGRHGCVAVIFDI